MPSVREAQLKLGSIIADGQWEAPDKSGNQHWSVAIQNVGKLSISGLNVIIKSEALSRLNLRVSPPVMHDIKKVNNTWYLTFSTQLAPDSTLQLDFQGSIGKQLQAEVHKQALGPSDVGIWVQSDSTPPTPVVYRGISSNAVTFTIIEPKSGKKSKAQVQVWEPR